MLSFKYIPDAIFIRVVLGTGRLTSRALLTNAGKPLKLRKAMTTEARPTNFEYKWVWLFLDTIMSMNEQKQIVYESCSGRCLPASISWERCRRILGMCS